jgi:dihydroxycyclohexadiene carboxylate dehydrogenase
MKSPWKQLAAARPGFVADLETYDGAQAAMARAVEPSAASTSWSTASAARSACVLCRVRSGADRCRDPPLAHAHALWLPRRAAAHAARGRGTIVNVSSNATRGIRRVPYSAAKGGVNAMTMALAMEYGEQGIRVVATAPGGTQAPPRRVPRNAPATAHRNRRGCRRPCSR